LRRLLLTNTAVGLEDTGGRKLTQLVAYHVFRNENRDKGFAVVNREGLTDEVRSNHGATAPGFDGLLVAGFDRGIDLGEKLLINLWAFFQ
jgi:hypothetical protein